ncbi:hypothetical protein AB0N09_19895 [Streptomyces erythrochromogenes]|uniref:hypothetical protein n=1 Tax=Streptomyces erythrochromogenes TaxID=285574 RepID=UPI003439DE51
MIQRSAVYSRLLAALAVLAVVAFVYTVVRENLPPGLTARWPWKLRILDFQSATAAVIATAGAALARAQYARAVRPALGYTCRVRAGHAPGGALTWSCHAFNGAQDVAVVTTVGYQVRFAGEPDRQEPLPWSDRDEVVSACVARGLVDRQDLWIDLIGAGRPIPGQGMMFLAWFAERALSDIETVLVRVRVVDRVGDVHERVLDLFKGVTRHPVAPDPHPFELD